MKPGRPCQKQVSPPFSGKGLAQPRFLFSSFPLSYFVSHRLWGTHRSIHASIHLAPDLFLSPLFIVSTHSDLTTSVVVFLAHFLLPSLSLLSFPLTHTFLYLISALRSPCLVLGSQTSPLLLFGTGFSLVRRVQSDTVTLKRWTHCRISSTSPPLLLCYYFSFW